MRSLIVKLRLLALALIAVPILFIPGMRQGAAQEGKTDADKLQAILGPDMKAWTFSGKNYSLVTVQGQPALTTDGVLTLTGTTRYATPTEYRFVFRLNPTPQNKYGALLSAAVGCAPKQSFTVNVSGAKDWGYISYNSAILPETGKSILGTLYLKAVNERSLSWSDEMRKTIEMQMAAAPKLDDMLLTLRMVVTPAKCVAWLNGRLIGQYDVKKGIDLGGTVNIAFYYNAELLSARAFPYQDMAARFEPIELGSFLNASALADGQPIVKKPVTRVDQNVDLDGVSFRFPSPDKKGNDHLDLTPSWTRFANLSGFIAASQYGPFGGRWVAADHIDPCRFCMYVPYGQYKALHLIAAFDGGKDKVPCVTAQFYRPLAGHPMNFAAKVPVYTAGSGGSKSFPVTLANGKSARLFHVVIPIDPDKMAWFSDLQRVGLELTKEIKPYRGYTDPMEFSWHGAGLPSGVQIYAATLEKAKVDVDPQPDATAHIWTAPATPSYTINLRNNSGVAIKAKLLITTASYDGKDQTHQVQTVTVPAGDATLPVKVSLQPTRYGLHTLTVACTTAGDTFSYTRSFAYLHPDTRERGDWVEGRGPIFGFWGWNGGHSTPGMDAELLVMAEAGAETNLYTYAGAPAETIELAKKWKYTSTAAFEGHCMYLNAFQYLLTGKYDPKDPEKTQKLLIDELKKIKVAPSALNHPEFLPFFPEPNLGMFTFGVRPTYYGEPDYQFTPEEETQFKEREQMFLLGARAVKKEWPDVKILLPYGDPNYTAIFLRKSPEARELIDGMALDLPQYERIPEQQIDQVTLNRLYPIMTEIRKYKKNPYMVQIEGPTCPSKDVDASDEEQADICTRNFLGLIGYGVNNHESANGVFDCANYWGENHNGGGNCTRMPLMMPKLAYVAYATLTRHVNRCNFVKFVPTGSTSVYCQQYKHYRDNHLVYLLWTIRGKRPVSVKVAPGATVEVYDMNDNRIVLKEKNGTVTFTIAQSPVYLEGMTGEAEITLGATDHSDAVPAKNRIKLTNLANNEWTLVSKHDEQYENTNPMYIARFLGDMTAKAIAAPKAQGSQALAVHLGPQQVDRKVMPYYTTFMPKTPIVIPGKADHFGLWVKAASDWGRVIYSLRDAKGERWLSVGGKDEWNQDDTRTLSGFNFDGWRYLRFELPSHSPYDCYRELGTSWWGSYDGDGVVDLPVKLEKIIVERRSSVVYGNDLVPARTDDVLLGDLYAEYASAFDMTDEMVRISALRMPMPAGAPTLDNPITDMAQTGVGAPTRVLKVADPAHEYNGTRCHVFFDAVDGAKSYDIWVSPYADGRGALKLGSAWTVPGQLLEGLCPEVDFYLFVVYTDKDGKLSKPSLPFKIHLKNNFLFQ